MNITDMPNVEKAHTIYNHNRELEFWYNYISYRMFRDRDKYTNEEYEQANKALLQYAIDNKYTVDGVTQFSLYSSDLYRKENKNDFTFSLKVTKDAC